MRINQRPLREKIKLLVRRADIPSCLARIRANVGAVRKSQSVDIIDSIESKVYWEITS